MKRISVIIIIFFLLVGCTNTYCPKKITEENIREIEIIIHEWRDVEILASVTQRINLPEQIRYLQEIKRTLENLDVSRCLSYTKNALLDSMGKKIKAYLVFIDIEQESFNEYYSKLSNNSFDLAILSLEKVKNCYPNCNEDEESVFTVDEKEELILNISILLSPDGKYCDSCTSASKNNWTSGNYIFEIPPNNYPFYDFKEPTFIIGRELINIAYNEIGFIVVTQFNNMDDLTSSFNSIIGYSGLKDIGEKYRYKDSGFYGWRYLSFIRCDYLITISSYGPLMEDIISYAKRLDGNLKPFLCNN